MGKFDIPNGGSEIATRFKEQFEADNAKLQASVKSLFETKAPAGSRPAAKTFTAWAPLPKYHRDHDGEFHERLSISLYTPGR